MEWSKEARRLIGEVHASLPADATLAQRKAAIREAFPDSWRGASWPYKAWLNERNLLPHGAWDWPSIVAMLNHHEDALRARSSAPPAREDAQPVASAYRVRPEMNDPEEWTLMHPERAFDYLDRPGWETQPLYTHPAPDALRVAVEALEKIKAGVVEVFDDELQCNVEASMDGEEASEIAAEALAALQAEQKGGAA